MMRRSTPYLVAVLACVCGYACTVREDAVQPAGDAGPSNTVGDAGDAGNAVACTETDFVLQGEALASRTLKQNCTYRLTGNYSFLVAGTELTIEPGVTVEAEGAFHIKTSHGARLIAKGTAAGPITLRANDATKAAGWQGLALGAADGGTTRHELRHVVVRDAGNANWVTTADDEQGAIFVWPDAGELSEVLFDHVTVEDAKHAGIRVFREGGAFAAGSTDIVVTRAKDWPLVLDSQNLRTLPAKQKLDSTTPERARILVLGGNEGTLLGEHVWAVQDLPFELVSIDFGVKGQPASSLTVQPPATLLMRQASAIRAVNAKLLLKATQGAPITLDWATEGKYWGGISLTADDQSTLAHQSELENITLRHGGEGNSPVVHILGPGTEGNGGDCSVGAKVTGCTFADRAPTADGAAVYCLRAPDHSNDYEAANTFTGCTNYVKCD